MPKFTISSSFTFLVALKANENIIARIVMTGFIHVLNFRYSSSDQLIYVFTHKSLLFSRN